METKITSLTIVYSTVYSGADRRKYQSSMVMAFVWRIHRLPVNSPHKGPVTRKMLPFDDVIMFVVVNFDALAQASDIRIERRQVVFLCWMQDSNPRSQTPIRQQTECLLTNRLSYQAKNLNSTARPYDQQTDLLCLVLFLVYVLVDSCDLSIPNL